MSKKDIAIVGMSCRFSKSGNLAAFWDNLRQGKELVHFLTAEEILQSGLDQQTMDDPAYIKIRSEIEGKDSFDAPFFGYSREEAALMDPQIRLFHENAWMALEDAGYDPFSYEGKIGVFAGASDNLNWIAHSIIKGADSDVAPFMADKISSRHYLSSLLAYKLNLRGPAYFIDTACSTSLAAVHLACRNLLMNECNMAIAGAVRISTVTEPGYKYYEGMIASRDGHCKTFDKEASGTMAGEGVGIVVLKRLDDALKDQDRIYAVIKSSAVNNDGSRKVGYTAPGIQGQAACIMLAHKLAGIDPNTISYIEAHGTATKLGDPAEIEALNHAFGNQPEKYCAIGSVKSNMGHLDTVAGIAGLIKTALSLWHKEIPPSLHFTEANPDINFNNGPFYVNNTLRRWEPRNGIPLRAGVSSFGIGGTNVHAVLEEAPEERAAKKEEAHFLLPCSARTLSSLEKQVAVLTAQLPQHKNNIADIAFTLQQRRKHFKYRHCFLYDRDTHAINNIQQPAPASSDGGSKPVIVLMFTGQGAQYRGMGKGLYDHFPVFKEVMEEGFSQLKKLTGEDFFNILYGEDADTINHTVYTQPALFVFEYALAKLLAQWGIQPDYMIGHSIGELTAACISGVFSFEDGIRLVVARARLMGAQAGGAMLSIGCPVESIEAYLREGISVAAINTPDSCVVAGSYEAIQALSDKLIAAEIPVARLRTSHAFHSDMMDPAVEEFTKVVATVRMAEPQIPFVSNRSGNMIGEEVLQPAYWGRHIRETVHFSKGLQAILPMDNLLFIEAGPGNTLAGFCRQISKAGAHNNWVLNLVRRPQETVADDYFFLEKIGQLWMQGVAVDWNAADKKENSKVVSLPGYQFDQYHFPVAVNPLAYENARPAMAMGTKQKDISTWFYIPGWKQSPLLDRLPEEEHPKNYLLFADESAFSIALKRLLEEKGHQVMEIRRGHYFEVQEAGICRINQEAVEDYYQLGNWLLQNGFRIDQIVYTWSCTSTKHKQYPSDASTDYFCLLNLYKGLGIHEHTTPAALYFITAGMYAIANSGSSNDVGASTAIGLLKVWSQENPHFFCSHVDISDEAGGISAHFVYRELLCNVRDTTVALRNKRRWVNRYEPFALQKNKRPVVKKKGNYLITGGLGQVGICIARHLLTHYEANIVLIGRSALSLKSSFDPVAGSDPVLARKLQDIAALQSLPGSVAYYAADITDQQVLEAVIRQVEAGTGAIDGVIHAAGDTAREYFSLIESTDAANVHRLFAAKVTGTMHLQNIFRDKGLDFFWATSSLSVAVGGLGYNAYASANCFMDHFIDQQNDQQGTWMSVNLDGLALSGAHEDKGIDPAELCEVFERSLQAIGVGRLAVSVYDLPYRLEKYTAKKQPAPAAAKEATVFDTGRPSLTVEYMAATTVIEKKLVVLWSEVLNIREIGVLDNFLDLGGDSLKAMTLSRKIHKEFGIELPMDFFFKNLTVQSYAAEIQLIESLKKINTVHTTTKELKVIII